MNIMNTNMNNTNNTNNTKTSNNSIINNNNTKSVLCAPLPAVHLQPHRFVSCHLGRRASRKSIFGIVPGHRVRHHEPVDFLMQIVQLAHNVNQCGLHGQLVIAERYILSNATLCA
jgi:hypothetical protein